MKAGAEPHQNQSEFNWMVGHLRRAVQGAHAMAAAAVLLVAFVLYTGSGQASVLYWAAALCTCEALLGILMLSSFPDRTWLSLYSTLHLIACLGWGLLPLFFFFKLPQAYQNSYAIVVLAAAVVSQPSLSYAPRLYMTGATFMTLPVAVALIVQSPQWISVDATLGAALIAGLGVLGIRVRQTYRSYHRQASAAISLQQAREALQEHKRILNEERIRADQASQWDPVTGAQSQRSFLNNVQELPQNRHRDAVAVCLKIAGFKYVNMAFGHETGDEILQETAARILKLAGNPRLVCRTGGGEFLAYIQPAPGSIREQLGRLFEDPCMTQQGTVSVNAYIGMARVHDGDSPLDAVHSAIHAAEEAKTEGDKTVRSVEIADLNILRNRSMMRFELSDALTRNEFHMVYQPQHNLTTRELVGFEALLRWESPVFGTVSPGVFIPIAEDGGLIRELGRWVCQCSLVEFCRHFADSDISLSINVSLAQLESQEFVPFIREELEKHQLRPDRLTLEITESLFMASPELIKERLSELREIGVRVALDDFGTGYSSLSYLTRIPLDDVKLDREFILDVAENPVSHTLVTSLLNICNAMNIRPVIEGVEARRQLDALAGFDSVIIQGFIFSRPLSIESAASYAESFIRSGAPGV